MSDFFSHCPICRALTVEPTEFCRRCGCHLLLLVKVKDFEEDCNMSNEATASSKNFDSYPS